MNLFGSTDKQSLVAYMETREALQGLLNEGVFRAESSDKIVYANRAFLNLFGHHGVPEVEINFKEIFAGERDAIYVNDKLKAGGIIAQQLFLFKRLDGVNFWGSFSCQRSKRGNEQVIEGVIHDVTNRIEQESETKEKAAVLEKTKLELDRFIYSASHDIRSPISTVLGLISLMKIELRDQKSHELVGMMETSINKLDAIVRELAAFARNTRQEIQIKQVDVKELVHGAIRQLKEEHPNFLLVKIKTKIMGGQTFCSDQERMHFCLYPVLKNAIDFLDASKPNKMIDIQVRVTPLKAIIEVFDNGIGISPAHLGSVFEMFYKGTSMSKGAGLGLYTAREAAIKLGGTISVNSRFAIGTSVRIEIPNRHTQNTLNNFTNQGRQRREATL